MKFWTRFGFGYADGDYRVIAVTETENEGLARNLVLLSSQNRVKVVKLENFTLREIKAIHEQMQLSKRQNRFRQQQI